MTRKGYQEKGNGYLINENTVKQCIIVWTFPKMLLLWCLNINNITNWFFSNNQKLFSHWGRSQQVKRGINNNQYGIEG